MSPTTTPGAGAADALPPVDVWFDAQVWCTDGHAGPVMGLVCSSTAPHLREVVVHDSAHPHGDHPIARGTIGVVDAHNVAVDMTRDDVRRRRLPTKTVFISQSTQWLMDRGLGGPGGWTPCDEPLQIPVTVPELADGDVLVRARAAVYANGYRIGQLAGLRVLPTTGTVTAMIVDVGHLWHHRYVQVPADDVDELTDAAVRIHGSREHVEHLPAPMEHATHDRDRSGRPPDRGSDVAVHRTRRVS